MKQRYCLLKNAIIMSFLSITWGSLCADESALRIRRIADVINLWQPQQHLYVKGNIGVDEERLSALEDWLDKHGDNWTIVLMDQAEDETYSAADGRDYVGMDAVEYGLGYGLSNRTGFGEQEEERTGESDGAVFALFLRERKFSYFGSDAQDRRGLGEANWVGELDQPAFRAMRGGGRILDAVKDTVTTINTRLENAIQAEADAVEREKRERLRIVEELQQELTIVRESIVHVERERDAFRGRFPKAEGELAKPPVDTWRNQLSVIEQQVTPELARDLSQKLAFTRDDVARFLNAYAVLPTLDARIADLETRRKELGEASIQPPEESLADIDVNLDSVRRSVAAGNPDIPRSIDELAASIQRADAQVAEELERLRVARARADLIRRTAIAVASIAAGVLVGFLFLLNRRRKKARIHSIQEFAERQRSVRQEMDRVMALFARSGEILGDRTRLAARGYEGETKALSEATLQYVDDLFVMSNEVKRVMQEARALIHPTRPWEWIVNLFSSARYERGINQVTGKPLKFSRDKGLPLVLRKLPGMTPGKKEEETGGAAHRKGLSPESEPQEIALTFEDVFRAFNERFRDAAEGLQTLEMSLAEVQTRLKTLQEGISQAEVKDQKLLKDGQTDGYFALPNFFEKLLPSLQADLRKADDLSGFDPVQAVRVPLAQGMRKLKELDTLAEIIEAARSQLFPILQQHADRLKAFDYRLDWIDERLDDLSLEANQLMGQAAESSIEAETNALESKLEELKLRAEKCVKLAERIHSDDEPQLAGLAGKIAETRTDLARQLQLDAERVLREIDLEPDDFLDRAQVQLKAARSMLQKGRADHADAALESMEDEAARTEAILVESRESVTNHHARHENLHQRAREIQSGLQHAKDALDIASKEFAHAALLLEPHARDEQVLHAPATQVLGIAETKLLEGQRSLQISSEQFKEGRVLHASRILRDSEQSLSIAKVEITRVENHLQRLRAQAAENAAELERLERELPGKKDAIREAWVTSRTIDFATSLMQQVTRLRKDVEPQAGVRNPAETAKEIASLKAQWQKLSASISADKDAFDEAARAVVGAERQLTVVRELVGQARTDRITDSSKITEMTRRTAVLGNDLPPLQQKLRTPHEDWQAIDDAAARLQSDLSTAAEVLRGEIAAAERSVQAFQQASQVVYQATQWSGPWGLRVGGSPGVGELERARAALQTGDYATGLQASQMASTAATAAIEQAEREVARRRMEEARAAEAARRAREAAQMPRMRTFGGGFPSSSSRSSQSRSSSSRGTFGGGGGGGGGSGFKRSGW
jgi:hypothetical protein